jgi:hypothetical protein
MGVCLDKQDWIPLNDFSVKYKVSLSTLRRRIRSGEIEHRFLSGKYWLLDQPTTKYQRPMASLNPVVPVVPVVPAVPLSPIPDDNFIESANKIMQELKSAYISVLHEKEEQIMQLKEEITNLKTLVQILESENDRLNYNVKESAPIDAWLSKNFDSAT